jgi:nitrate/nitrite transporter NarK
MVLQKHYYIAMKNVDGGQNGIKGGNEGTQVVALFACLLPHWTVVVIWHTTLQ